MVLQRLHILLPNRNGQTLAVTGIGFRLTGAKRRCFFQRGCDAGAQAILLFAIILFLTYVQNKVFGEKVFYG